MEQTGRALARIDGIGTLVSGACAVHCVLLPFVITVLPLVGLGFLAGSIYEVVLLSFAICLATMSFCWGTRVHNKRRIWLLLSAAIVFFVAAHLDHEGQLRHAIFMAMGGSCIAIGHIVNRRLCRRCHECEQH